ncbi:endoglucanase [Cohaesibacter sp. ES.047]|uniref:glycoside hydrolase family 5 protein n=1 Tax=Cohaesibacter sp. ES.047 TaxID=1798205 RepID=UPI000BB853A9|nr:cellulase family glycosylhydrolase [Cohaesibacter sp. ES.047]SNY91774.1 endoglucanase [Cohaesibacter sp. ES.047]
MSMSCFLRGSMRIVSCFAVCFTLALITGVTTAAMAGETEDGLSSCEEGRALSPAGADAKLARGFNLPNWEPSHTGLKPDKALLELLRKEGFSHVRLPVDGEWLMADFTDVTETDRYLATLEKEVLRLNKLGFAVTVDMHPGGRFQALHRMVPDKAFALLIEAWDLVVSRSRSWPKDDIYFELLNEPVPSQDIWWSQAQVLVTHLNAAAPTRGLIVGPAVFQRYEPLLSAQPLKGNRLTYAIHYYDPFVFTHQAMSWDPGSYLSKVGQLPFPGNSDHPQVAKAVQKLKDEGKAAGADDIEKAYEESWDAARVAADLAPVGEWSKRYGVPVIVNEFGVLTFDVDPWARHDWLAAVRKGAEDACLGWTHWDFSDGFALVDSATTLPDPLVLDALFGAR